MSGDTRIVSKTERIYELRLRLFDGNFKFKIKQQTQLWGDVMAIFLDLDDNEFEVFENPKHHMRAFRYVPRRASQINESYAFDVYDGRYRDLLRFRNGLSSPCGSIHRELKN